MTNESNDSASQKKWINIYINGGMSRYNSKEGYTGMNVFEYESPALDLYDIVIFDDQIQLYKFNNSLYHSKPSEDFLIHSLPIPSLKGNILSYLKSSLHDISPSIFSHPHIERSKLIAEALKEFTQIIHLESKAEHYAIHSKAHGDRNDEGIFQNNLLHAQAQDFLLNLTKTISQKLDILDFSGNCYLGNFDIVSHYAEFTKYIIAASYMSSGHDGHYDLSKEPNIIFRYSLDGMTGKAFYPDELETQMHNIFNNSNVLEVASKIIDLSRIKNIESKQEHQVHQYSLSLYDTKYFNPFITSLQQELQKKTNIVDKHDVFQLTQQVNNAELENLFLQLRPNYITNEEYFSWTEESNGLYTHGLHEIFAYKDMEISGKQHELNIEL